MGIVVIPIHDGTEYADNVVHGDDSHRTVGKFVRLTASNVKPGSPSLWSPSQIDAFICLMQKCDRIHFFCVYAFIVYALVLLNWHLRRYVRLRHEYLSSGMGGHSCPVALTVATGSDPNQWRTKTFPQSPAPNQRLMHSSMFTSFVESCLCR